MIWMLVIGVIVVAMLYILWQLEQIGKANKGLKGKLQAKEQEMLKLQQAAYQLAEQQKTALEQQLTERPLNPALTSHEQQLIRLLCTSLPVVVKECCTKGMTPHQVMSAYLKRHSTYGGNQLELMTKKQTRLTTLWHTNSVISHLQLCTVAVALATEQEQAKVSSL